MNFFFLACSSYNVNLLCNSTLPPKKSSNFYVSENNPVHNNYVKFAFLFLISEPTSRFS